MICTREALARLAKVKSELHESLQTSHSYKYHCGISEGSQVAQVSPLPAFLYPEDVIKGRKKAMMMEVILPLKLERE